MVGSTREDKGHGFEIPWAHRDFSVVSFFVGGTHISINFYTQY